MKRKKVKRMATSTFTKKIVLSNTAAKRLAKELDKNKVPRRPVLTKEMEESEAAWAELLNRYKK